MIDNFIDCRFLTEGDTLFVILSTLQIYHFLIQASRIASSQDLYATWVETPENAGAYIKYYFFHVTNPEDIVEKQAKPKVLEMGPYVFR